MENLREGGAVDGEVVDGFVDGGLGAFIVRGLGEHAEDGFGVGGC